MSEQTEEKAKTYKCGACGHVQARGKVWRKGWIKCRACDSCGATSWIPQEKGGLDCAAEVRRKFKIIISLDPPLIFTDNWPSKPSKDHVLEILANDIRQGKYDSNFHVIVEEVKEA
jgi:hypothetical protein